MTKIQIYDPNGKLVVDGGPMGQIGSTESYEYTYKAKQLQGTFFVRILDDSDNLLDVQSFVIGPIAGSGGMFGMSDRKIDKQILTAITKVSKDIAKQNVEKLIEKMNSAFEKKLGFMSNKSTDDISDVKKFLEDKMNEQIQVLTEELEISSNKTVPEISQINSKIEELKMFESAHFNEIKSKFKDDELADFVQKAIFEIRDNVSNNYKKMVTEVAKHAADQKKMNNELKTEMLKPFSGLSSELDLLKNDLYTRLKPKESMKLELEQFKEMLDKIESGKSATLPKFDEMQEFLLRINDKFSHFDYVDFKLKSISNKISSMKNSVDYDQRNSDFSEQIESMEGEVKDFKGQIFDQMKVMTDMQDIMSTFSNKTDLSKLNDKVRGEINEFTTNLSKGIGFLSEKMNLSDQSRETEFKEMKGDIEVQTNNQKRQDRAQKMQASKSLLHEEEDEK